MLSSLAVVLAFAAAALALLRAAALGFRERREELGGHRRGISSGSPEMKKKIKSHNLGQ
jgi:hypothetical protein